MLHRLLPGRFNRPLIQVVFLGFVCLCCPGMYNALSGLGAGGSMGSNFALVSAANGALYGCFAVVAFFAGSVTNTMGIKPTLTVGTAGYALYSASLWVYDRKQVSAFVIAAGAILGCCAGLLWAAQGAIMMSYPEEKNKGKYVAVFWALFNFGGILGSLITLGLNLENYNSGVSTATYAAFVAIMLFGVVLSLFLAAPTQVIRADGSRVAVAKSAHWSQELKGVLLFWKEWRMLALSPAFLASNWFYAYQFRVNAIYFDASTRALNDTMYWGFQILGSFLFGLLLDFGGLSRRGRALVAWVLLFCIMMAIWAGGMAFQLTFDNAFDTPIRWTHPGFGGPFVLFIFYGFSDALYQTYMYWLMGAMSNDPQMLARYAGYYKALQSAGGAISYGLDALNIPLRWECMICWIILFVSFFPMFFVANQVAPSSEPQPSETDPEDQLESKLEASVIAHDS